MVLFIKKKENLHFDTIGWSDRIRIDAILNDPNIDCSAPSNNEADFNKEPNRKSQRISLNFINERFDILVRGVCHAPADRSP